MEQYSFEGTLHLEHKKVPFERTVEAESQEHAEDIVYSQLGSEHSLPRSRIDVNTKDE